MSSLEKQQEKLNKLNEQIKAQKEKIDKKLGHDIIKKSGIDYSELNKNELTLLSDKIAQFLSKENTETASTETEKSDDMPISNSDSSDLNNHKEY
ncbi:hypothetical protein EFM21_02035 [Leuconostoc falkenbergense]|jgi:NMD protein affecting ribosome stability and mRNA decay|uniref:hypothetical protein n=1 Tax=Lactobacillales TaxID=186826 RepID=UPI0007E29A68|nr:MULTISPECIES: hypothetical protein [Lactobacillales]MCT1224400.1 hypothetical protein [Lactiplantibacillus plantarum]MCT4377952.1 hypothetical protein [Leuconostoc falkenbergense]MDB1685764.1 hypothetical protein [Enterococcus durans]CUW15833.1 hypothetical protein C120C_1089 [Leuconostoc inhae]